MSLDEFAELAHIAQRFAISLLHSVVRIHGAGAAAVADTAIGLAIRLTLRWLAGAGFGAGLA